MWKPINPTNAERTAANLKKMQSPKAFCVTLPTGHRYLGLKSYGKITRLAVEIVRETNTARSIYWRKLRVDGPTAARIAATVSVSLIY